MNLAQEKMRQEYPKEMKTATIKPTGLVGRLADKFVQKVIGGAPVATANPFGGIRYNPELASSLPQDELEDMLAHELTHVRQYQDMPLGKRILSSILPQKDEGLPAETAKSFRMQGYDPIYRGKSTEMEAYGAEQQRQLQRGASNPYDIYLPPESLRKKFAK
jgi:hypothetical protein